MRQAGARLISALHENPDRLRRWGRVAAVLLPLVLFSGSLENDFLIDDEIIVTSNVRLDAGGSPLDIFTRPEQFMDFTLPYYRPVTNLTYWIDAQIWGGQPAGFHLTNWLLHAANTLLTFEWTLGLTSQPLLATMTAALFAAHPIHTESVDMVQGRTDLLTTLFTLLSLLALHQALASDGTRRRAGSLFLCYLGLGGALLSKETAVVWPALATASAWAVTGREPKRQYRWIAIVLGGLVVILGYMLVRQAVLGRILAVDLSRLGTPLVGLVPISLATYLSLLVWPFTFSFIRQIPAPEAWTDPRILTASLTVLGMLLVLILAARRDRLVGLGALWMLAPLLPVANLFPIPGFAVAERYLYLPSVGFCLLAAALGRRFFLTVRLPHLRGLLGVASVILLIGFAVTIQVRTAQWSNPLAVYEAMARRSPDSFFVQTNLGLEYLHQGRFSEALAALWRARDLDPLRPIAWNNLGVALEKSGRLEESRDAYQRAIRLDAAYATAYENLGRVLLALGDASGAGLMTRQATEIRMQPRR